MKKSQVITSLISTGTYQEMTEEIFRLAEQKDSSYVCFSNVHMVTEAYKDKAFNRMLNEADMATPDGVPLRIAMRLMYGIKQERVAGMDMFPSLMKEAEQRGKSIFLFGGKEEVLVKIAEKASKEFPDLKIAGYLSPPFRKLSAAEEQEIVDQINAAAPDLMFIALGCPKQEKWAAKHKNKVNSCMLAVGGAFNVYAGVQDRAPEWMQKASLEWLHRLLQEPGRLFKRYFLTNSMFLLLFLKSFIMHKSGIRRAKAQVG